MNEVKIFFNDSLLRIVESDSIDVGKNSDFYQLHHPKEWGDIIDKMEKFDDPCEFVVIVSQLETAWRDFNSLFVQIIAAGGFVVNEQNEFLVIERLGKWDLPKGKVEKAESVEAAAIREVNEECGITGVKVTDFLGITYHVYKINEKRVLKETYWFRMSALNQPLIPQESENITGAFWLSLEQLTTFQTKTYASIADFITHTFSSMYNDLRN